MPIREPGGLNGAVYGGKLGEMQAAGNFKPTFGSLARFVQTSVITVKDYFGCKSLFSYVLESAMLFAPVLAAREIRPCTNVFSESRVILATGP
jgi:hypothetical protein